MHIVQYFPGVIPPEGYGGIERLVFWLTRELARRRLRVTLMADPRSRIAETLPDVNLVPLDGRGDFRGLIPRDADVIHLHSAPARDLLPDLPFIVTEHGNRHHAPEFPPNTVFVSHSHAANHGGRLYVHNGIPREEYPLQKTKRHQIVFMAKVSWRAKNAKTAIRLSLDSGMPLLLAGGDPWRTRKVWGSWMWPALWKRGLIRSAGVVSGQHKLTLLQESRLLFYLVNWQEPYGLACMEALSCGTPVLASPNGALPEYVRHGENGYIAQNYRQALGIVKHVMAMSPAETASQAEACHASVRSIEAVADDYLKLYEHVVDHGYLYPEEERARLRFVRPASVEIRA